MTKALLTNLNSVWGTKIHPQSSNTYSHILSFDNEDLKKQFIDKELFEGKDHIALLAQQPNIALTQITGNLASFRVNPMDYPDETIDTLLNKDFAIIQENSKTRYYTLVGTRKGTQIEYVADLDIFFTYDVKDMFNDSQTRISRAMTDRYKVNGNILENYYKLDTKHEMVIQNSEQIEKNISDNQLYVKSDTISKGLLFEQYINPAITDVDKRNEIINRIANMEYPFLVTKINDNQQSEILEHPYDYPDTFSSVNEKGNKITQPYAIVVTTQCEYASKGENIQVQRGSNQGFGWVPYQTGFWGEENAQSGDLLPFIPGEIKSPQIIKTSYSIAPMDLLSMFVKYFESKGTTDFIGIGYDEKLDRIQVNINFEKIGVDRNSPINFKPSTFEKNVRPLKWRMVINTFDAQFIQNETIINEIFPDLNINDIKYSNNVNDYKYEIKTQISPYKTYEIKSSTNNKLKILPQFFTKNSISLKQAFGFLPEQWTQWVKINAYKNQIWTNGELPFELDESYEDVANYSFATDINAFEEFMTTNKSAQTSGFINKGISAGLGVAGVVGSIATGGALGLAGLGLGSIALKSAGEINSQFAQRSDIKRTPDKLVNKGSQLAQDFLTKELKSKLYLKELTEIDKRIVNEYIFKYGYNFNNRLQSISSLLKSRYYFNYIEIPETFENTKLQASGTIKQIINDTMSNGVTIWHIRDLSTFKGVKNYLYENVEMSIVEAQNVKK